LNGLFRFVSFCPLANYLVNLQVYPAQDAPYYRTGMWVCAGFILFNGFLALGLRCLLVWENGRLDRKYGVVERGGVKRGVGDGPRGRAGIGEENDGPGFRYVL
jgi:hypothetical protein